MLVERMLRIVAAQVFNYLRRDGDDPAAPGDFAYRSSLDIEEGPSQSTAEQRAILEGMSRAGNGQHA